MLKSVKVTVAGLLIGLATLAQPSEGIMKAKIRTFYSNPIHKIDFGTKSSPERKFENGVAVTEYYETYFVYFKTKYPGVYQMWQDGVVYINRGNGYQFDHRTYGGSIGYDGIPDPDETEMEQIVQEAYNPLKCLSHNSKAYVYKIEQPPVLNDNPDWHWSTLNEVTGEGHIVVSRRVSTYKTNLEVVTHKSPCTFVYRRSKDGQSYNKESESMIKDGKWEVICTGCGSSSDGEELKRWIMTQAEFSKITTFGQREREAEAKAVIASLPDIEIPEFKTHNHVIQYTHELLRKGNADNVKAYLYKMMPPNYFYEDITIEPNNFGRSLLENAINNIEFYSDAYCQYPKIYHQQTGMVQFYDKNKRSFNRIAVTKKNGRYYVTEIQYGKVDVKPGNENNCGDPIDIEPAPVYEKYEVGDQIKANIGGTWHRGYVDKVDNMMKDRYFVKFESINGKWITADIMKYSEGGEKAITSFTKGDKVMILYRNKWYKGEVLEKDTSQNKYKVVFYEDNATLWTYPEKLKLSDSSDSSKEDKDKANSSGLSTDSQKENKNNKLKNKAKNKLKGLDIGR